MHPQTGITVQTHMQATCSGTSGMKPILQRVASDFHFLFHMWGMNGLIDIWIDSQSGYQIAAYYKLIGYSLGSIFFPVIRFKLTPVQSWMLANLNSTTS
ncbi:hypothetical protein UNDYM_3886 [Undibacterium sp. YM2]|uniref:hypothetical protein n=1 Tax=Undibacterium sp. YM2 TaxID=2058625 RepID=UPI001331FC08|nr:hypothetical protein [Undibacterium sp. YM2]BBB68139.1 hypothetical protein UNDYM_3886 [Undibacterium sp. YM2]